MNGSSAPRIGFAGPEAIGQRPNPTWPTLSIGVLLVLEIVMPAGFMTLLDACLVILAAIVWFTSRIHLPRPFFEIVLPFVAISIVGLLSGLGADTYAYLKDAWYTSNPALIFGAGYVLYRAKPDMARGLRAFVLGGTVIALIYMIPFAADPSLLFLQAARSRELVGVGYFAPALALLMLVACRRDTGCLLRLPRWLAWTCLLLCAMASIMSFSRTILLTTAVGLLATQGVFARRVLLKVAVVAVVAAAILSVLPLTVDVQSSDSKQSFMGKLANSLDEMSMHEYFDFKRINESYRGFESARALHAYEEGEPLRWLIGQGFGAEVDLKVWVPGVGRYLPVLHNGYMYLLFKGGVLAVGLFLVAVWRLYVVGLHAATASDSVDRLTGRLVQGIALALLFTTWVIAGVFNKLDMYPFLLSAGYLCAYLTGIR